MFCRIIPPLANEMDARLDPMYRQPSKMSKHTTIDPYSSSKGGAACETDDHRDSGVGYVV